MTDVFCGTCDTPLDEPPGLLPAERESCPTCDSTTRRVLMRSSETIGVNFTATATLTTLAAFPSLPDMLLRSVVTFGDKTHEGRLVAAVAQPWFDIIALLKDDPAAAFQIPPEKWEEIVAGSYEKAGFTEVTLTPRSGDHGRDVVAVMRGIGSVRVIDQVKAYRPGHRVRADDVRALYGVMKAEKANKAIVTTTSAFAPRIFKDPVLMEKIPNEIELINGENLLRRLQELAKGKAR